MIARWQGPAIALAASILTGCVPEQMHLAEPRPVVSPPTPSSSLFASHPVTEPLNLERVVINIRANTKIGYHSGCLGCRYGSGDLFWDPGTVRPGIAEFRSRFFNTMGARGYTVIGDPSRLFNEESQRAAARFLIGAEINNLEVAMARTEYMFVGPRTTGSLRLRINWQVYSMRERRVVFETTSEGTSSIDRPNYDPVLPLMIIEAFDVAAERLSRIAAFREAVATREASYAPSQTEQLASLDIPAYRRFQGPIASRIGEVRSSSVTILSGSGHGSGFFVSEDGLILTNQHVVGNAEQVNVRLAAGVEVVGRVLRREAVRDVALVKVDITRARPLPISTTVPGVGNEVYALGSPADPNLAGTLTRGIVSALRSFNRGGVALPMIQSDTAIYGGNSGGPLLDASGNAIGIAVESAADRGQAVVGVNYFIPIEDALRHLNIQLGQPRELRF